jgi:hypothetical protein
MIVMETASLQTVEICYYGGYVPLFVTMRHGLSSCILPWINTVVFYQLILYQLDNNDGARDTTSEWFVCAQDHYQ